MVKYIKAEVDKHLYMEVPDGFENLAGFLKIKKKAINDLKQVGRMWNNKMNST